METTNEISRDDLQSMANDAGCYADIFSSNISKSDTFNYVVAGIAGAIVAKAPGGAIALGVIIALEENRKVQFENMLQEMIDNDYDYLVVTTSYEFNGYDETSGIPNYRPTGVTYSYE